MALLLWQLTTTIGPCFALHCTDCRQTDFPRIGEEVAREVVAIHMRDVHGYEGELHVPVYEAGGMFDGA